MKDYTTNEFDPDDWWAGEETPEPMPTETGKYVVGSTKSDKHHYPDSLTEPGDRVMDPSVVVEEYLKGSEFRFPRVYR